MYNSGNSNNYRTVSACCFCTATSLESFYVYSLFLIRFMNTFNNTLISLDFPIDSAACSFLLLYVDAFLHIIYMHDCIGIYCFCSHIGWRIVWLYCANILIKVSFICFHPLIRHWHDCCCYTFYFPIRISYCVSIRQCISYTVLWSRCCEFSNFHQISRNFCIQ